MLIFVEKNQIKSITYLGATTGSIYPEKDISPYDLILKNFRWLEDKRPKKREDIFKWVLQSNPGYPEKTDDYMCNQRNGILPRTPRS